jgi:hypothetical protein
LDRHAQLLLCELERETDSHRNNILITLKGAEAIIGIGSTDVAINFELGNNFEDESTTNLGNDSAVNLGNEIADQK